MEQFSGSSFRDLTRVPPARSTCGPTSFWINAVPVDTAIGQFIAALEALRRALAGGDAAQLKTQLLRAREARQRWSAARA